MKLLLFSMYLGIDIGSSGISVCVLRSRGASHQFELLTTHNSPASYNFCFNKYNSKLIKNFLSDFVPSVDNVDGLFLNYLSSLNFPFTSFSNLVLDGVEFPVSSSFSLFLALRHILSREISTEDQQLFASLTLHPNSPPKLKETLLDACRVLNIKVLSMIPSTFAASIRYTYQHNAKLTTEPQRCVFVDVGYSCTEVSIVEVSKSLCYLLEVVDFQSICGTFFDKNLFDYILNIIEKNEPYCSLFDSNCKLTRLMILEECKNTRLTFSQKRVGRYQFSFERCPLLNQCPKIPLSLRQYESLCDCSDVVNYLQSLYDSYAFTSIVLIGGISLCPWILNKIENFSSSKKIKVTKNLKPFAAVSEGLCYYTAVLGNLQFQSSFSIQSMQSFETPVPNITIHVCNLYQSLANYLSFQNEMFQKIESCSNMIELDVLSLKDRYSSLLSSHEGLEFSTQSFLFDLWVWFLGIFRSTFIYQFSSDSAEKILQNVLKNMSELVEELALVSVSSSSTLTNFTSLINNQPVDQVFDLLTSQNDENCIGNFLVFLLRKIKLFSEDFSLEYVKQDPLFTRIQCCLDFLSNNNSMSYLLKFCSYALNFNEFNCSQALDSSNHDWPCLFASLTLAKQPIKAQDIDFTRLSISSLDTKHPLSGFSSVDSNCLNYSSLTKARVCFTILCGINLDNIAFEQCTTQEEFLSLVCRSLLNNLSELKFPTERFFRSSQVTGIGVDSSIPPSSLQILTDIDSIAVNSVRTPIEYVCDTLVDFTVLTDIEENIDKLCHLCRENNTTNVSRFLKDLLSLTDIEELIHVLGSQRVLVLWSCLLVLNGSLPKWAASLLQNFEESLKQNLTNWFQNIDNVLIILEAAHLYFSNCVDSRFSQICSFVLEYYHTKKKFSTRPFKILRKLFELLCFE
ncbi:hypothetical protein RCL1_004772 [Eukaryota sp. TZLM3-RCL]